MQSAFNPSQLKVTGNKLTDQYIASARDLGLDIEIVSRRSGLVKISGQNRNLTVQGAAAGLNNYAATLLSYNKFATSRRLQSGGFRVPRSDLFDTTDYATPRGLTRALRLSDNFQFPLVLKPVRGLGGNNVFAGIADEEELEWAANLVWHDVKGEIVMEQHIEGNHYRIKIMDGVLIHLLQRIPANITGDGKQTIRQLIDQANEYRAEIGRSKMDSDERAVRVLKQSGFSLDSILPDGVNHKIRVECNTEIGGDIVDLSPKILQPEVLAYFSRVAKFAGLRWAGLDFICKDISLEDAHETGYINETAYAQSPMGFSPGMSREEYLSLTRDVLSMYFET